MADTKLTRDAIEQVLRYVAMRKAQPLRGIGNQIHAIHTGTEFEASLNLSDLDCLCRHYLATEQDARGAARWRSIRHVKNLEVEMMKPVEWDRFVDDRIAKRDAALSQKESQT